jgi:hypothetical protein
MSDKIAFRCNGCAVSEEGRILPFHAHELPGANPVGTLFVRPPRGWYVVTCMITSEDEVRLEDSDESVMGATGAMVLAVCPACAEKRRFYGAPSTASA